MRREIDMLCFLWRVNYSHFYFVSRVSVKYMRLSPGGQEKVLLWNPANKMKVKIHLRFGIKIQNKLILNSGYVSVVGVMRTSFQGVKRLQPIDFVEFDKGAVPHCNSR